LTVNTVPCRGEWLGGKSSKMSYHKDGSLILMTVKGINPVCGSSIK